MAEPEWIVNDDGELGVKVGRRFYFLYKGDNLEYKDGVDGIAHHDDGTQMKYRPVGKREFGETVWPMRWMENGRREVRYTQELEFRAGLSFGKPGDCDWRPLPVSIASDSLPDDEALETRIAGAILSKVPYGYGMTTKEAIEYARAAIETLKEAE